MRKFETIACYILVIGAVISISLMFLTSCSPKTISTVTTTTQKKDSTNSTSRNLNDSSYYKETYKEKKSPEATIGITLSKSKLDSLIVALGNLPSSGPQIIYLQDPKLKAQLSIMLDSLGQFKVLCTALEQTYLERHTEQGRYIKKLEEQKNSVNKTLTVTTDVTKEKRPSLWQSIKGFSTFLIVFIVIVLGIGLWSKIKPWFT